MQMAVELPDDLAVIPPGPGLAAALGEVELGRVPNDRMLEVLRAQYRQLCHEQARTAAVLAEVGRCASFPAPGRVVRLSVPDRFAADESRAALCWTRRAAQDEHDLAEAVVSHWPAVFAAWLAGDIDRPRVRVFDHYLTGLNEVQVAGICRAAVPKANRLTTGQLAVLLRRMVIVVDPDAAARWYREGIRRRGVVAYPAADGTITLSAHGLPADEAEAACTRLQELAARAKRRGHPGLIDQIRADLYLGLLDGRFHFLTAEQLIAALIAEYHAEQPTVPASDDADCAPESARSATKPAGSATKPAGSATKPAGSATRPAEPDAGPTAPDRPADDPTAPDIPGRSAAAPGSTSPFDRARDQRVGIEIRIGLTTLLGRDEHPAEIPGLGLLPAPDARRRVALQTRAEWRFALTDTEGRLVFDGITRRRPRRARRDGPPGGIVELHVPLSVLTELQAADLPARDVHARDLPSRDLPAHGEWAGVIADIAAQYAGRDNQPRDLDAKPDARLPRAALRRHTEIRDRSCTFMGCRRRAHSTQQDHTRDYQHGGATVRVNLGPLCPHDHQVKHLGGWRVEQPRPGSFIWHSPLGGEYRTTGETFLPPMPDPAPTDPAPADRGAGVDLGYDDVQPDRPVSPILYRPEAAQPLHQSPQHQPPQRPLPRGSPDVRHLSEGPVIRRSELAVGRYLRMNGKTPRTLPGGRRPRRPWSVRGDPND